MCVYCTKHVFFVVTGSSGFSWTLTDAYGIVVKENTKGSAVTRQWKELFNDYLE